MNKQGFLNELDRLTAGLSGQERARLSEYYGEMIDDRVEEGVPEEEAVAALGDPAALAGELASCAPQAASATASSETVAALNSLRVSVGSASVTVVREALDGGMAAQLRLSDPDRFEWRMDGDTLELTERMVDGKKRALEFGLRWLRQMISEPDLRVTIALSEGIAGALDFKGGGADLLVEGVSFSKAQLVTGSGDIRLKDVDCAGGIGIDIRTHSGDVSLAYVRAANMMAHAASGDISADNLALSGRLRMETASGDIELRSLDCGALSLNTASGDIEVDRGHAATVSIHTASCDVRVDELEAGSTLSVETGSGEIELSRCAAPETRLNAVSGDVSLRLAPLPCGYDVTANSVSGDIHFDDGVTASRDGEAQPRIDVRTVSGDIEAQLIG